MDSIDNMQNDDELVASFCAGNNQAFETLVLRYKNSLYQYILSLVKDESTAEDLFQDVFISVFKHAKTYKAEGKFKAWLFLAARNKVLNYWRDHKNTVSLDQTDDEGNAYLQETVADNSRPVLDDLTWQDFQESVRQAIEQLSPRQREMIYLRQFLSFQEIADTVGRPLGTVLADCHRAVKKIRQLMEQTAQGETL
ncbi:MAG: RNA polymerase sigma factor [Elusimicrobiaceae bacterium]|nr:RNA polymerase sigma factor [Elusimicrobiaceae bacterium]